MAHSSLRGTLDAATFTDGTPCRLIRPLTDLLARPHGPRDRQLLLGDSFTVIDQDQNHSFGFAAKDGYCGWLPDAALAMPHAPTHWLAVPASHLYPEPRVQAQEIATLNLCSRLQVTSQTEKWSETPHGFVPTPHLRALGDWATCPVSVAATLLHTPYLWGGNSNVGLDCSGLVQLAFHACGLPCPGDSDLQQTLGHPPAPGPAQRGDLIFWRGHVALVHDPDTILHANGHTMSVAFEPLQTATRRIAAQGGGPILCHRRP